MQELIEGVFVRAANRKRFENRVRELTRRNIHRGYKPREARDMARSVAEAEAKERGKQ